MVRKGDIKSLIFFAIFYFVEKESVIKVYYELRAKQKKNLMLGVLNCNRINEHWCFLGYYFNNSYYIRKRRVNAFLLQISLQFLCPLKLCEIMTHI